MQRLSPPFGWPEHQTDELTKLPSCHLNVYGVWGLKYNKNVKGLDYNVSNKESIKYKLKKNYDKKKYDVAILLVNHRKYKNIYSELNNKCKILIDLFNFYK